MPITEELKNMQKLESVGFDHKQAEALADIIEQAQANGNESLKDFIRSTVKESENNLRSEMKDLRYDILLKIIIVVSSASGLLFTAIKLFT